MAEILDGIADRQKIDSATTLGLNGTNNSLAYRVHEVERHLHSYERWFETAAVANGEIHVADPAGTGGGVFQMDAGNVTWGAWLQILGSSDTPAITGSVKFDPDQILVTAAERNVVYVVQIGFGASGAAALSAGTYTEKPFIPAGGVVDSGPMDVKSKRIAVGTKAWVRCICPGQNTATLDFMIGIHEYEG